MFFVFDFSLGRERTALFLDFSHRLFFINYFCSVFNTSKLETATFGAKTRQKPPQFFSLKTATILAQTATILEISDNTKKFQKFCFFSTRPKKFFPPHESPKPPLTRQIATIENTVFLIQHEIIVS